MLDELRIPQPVLAELRAIAGHLGTEFAEFPGGITAPVEPPQAFAARPRSLLVRR